MNRRDEAFWRGEVRLGNRKVRLRPRDSLGYQMRGRARARLGRLEPAIRDFDQALELEPASASIHFERGNALFDAVRYAEAVADYGQAVGLGWAVVFYNRALAYRNLGRSEEALADYGRALGLKPEYVDALNNRGGLLNELGRHGEALEDLERGLAFAPDDPLLHANRASSLLGLGRLTEAQETCDHALALDPSRSSALYDKARAFALNGDAVEAARWLDKALVVDPSHGTEAAEDTDFDAVRNHPAFLPLATGSFGPGSSRAGSYPRVSERSRA